MQILPSSITAVTVFTDRALVVRTAQTHLEIGEHHLLFDVLPETIHQKSVQVSGLGDADLRNVKFKREFYAEIPEENSKNLYDEKQKITDELSQIQMQLARLEKEKFFVDEIVKKVTASTKKSDSAELDPAKWLKMIAFYREKLNMIDTEMSDSEAQKRKLNNQKGAIESKINQLGSPKNKERNQVEVIVEMKSAGNLILELSYMVKNASWIPVYDLRVDNERKQMNITYNAIIKQSTGENWRIDIYNNSYSKGVAKSSVVRDENVALNTQNAVLAGLDQVRGEANLILKKMDKKSAKVETNATAVFFQISGNHTIKSDNTDHKVTILVEDFPAHFRYSSTPKLSPYAYLKAKVRNESEYPFLAGETNVFLDNNFVANASMKTVAPSEEFWTFLGIDESMKVEHKFLKKYEKQEGGFISKKTKIIAYEYQIKVKNNKKSQEEIVIWDQLPISQNSSIKVHLIEPIYKEDTETLKKNEFDALKWFYKPKPSEEILIHFKFSVEYPHDAYVEGLE